MPQNIEIKARIRDLAELLRRVAATGAQGPQTLVQTDTFYRCPGRGRLKLREMRGQPPELILYLRPDGKDPKACQYIRLPLADVRHARAILAATHGRIGIVRKIRKLYLHNRVRIHVDRVRGLGNYLELEVLLTGGRTPAAGRRIARDLMKRLGVRQADLIRDAYIDMLRRV